MEAFRRRRASCPSPSRRLFSPGSDSAPSPRILYPTAPSTAAVRPSQPLTLECVVSGSPPPAARWFKDGRELPPGPPGSRRHNNLVFASVSRADEGVYSCGAETERGDVFGANYTVKVLGESERRKKRTLG